MIENYTKQITVFKEKEKADRTEIKLLQQNIQQMESQNTKIVSEHQELIKCIQN